MTVVHAVKAVAPKEMRPKRHRKHAQTGHLNCIPGWVWCNECNKTHHVRELTFNWHQSVMEEHGCKEEDWSTLWTQFQEHCPEYWEAV